MVSHDITEELGSATPARMKEVAVLVV